MRLDKTLSARGLVRSRSQAQALIGRGVVEVNGVRVTKASTLVGDSDEIIIEARQWVSRAAYKLLGALEDLRAAGFELPLARTLDAGASTGGFSQVMLEEGAPVIYAVDVGHGQLAQELRADQRIKVREGLNLRDLQLSDLDSSPVDLIVGDVSFISLKLLLEPLSRVLKTGGKALLLVKPQFEVGRHNLGSGGVVREEKLRLQAVEEVIEAAIRAKWRPLWQGQSKLPGPAGNIEHFVYFSS